MDPPLANNSINNSEEIQNSSLDNSNHDDNVRIAATALNDMRAGASHSNSGTPPITPNATDQAVSRLPAVLNSAMNLYDYGKANSRVISYGAGMVESGVQAISRPVLDRLPARVLNYGRSEPPSAVTPSPPGPLLPAIAMREDAASSSMQLDTSERESSSSDPAREEQRKRAESWTHQQRQARRLDSGENSDRPDSALRTQIGAENEANDLHEGLHEDDEERMDLSNPDRTQSSTLSDTTRFSKRSDGFASPSEGRKHGDVEPSQAVSRRAGWQSLMVEAGGISAAVSDESMRKLKYCLEWLQWATANLDTQITLLETFIASINATVTGEPVPSSATVSPEALQHYMSVKRNVVNTIRQVVEVVGKYAGGSLPEPAKQKVKGFILSLPGRWSVAVKDAGLGDAGWESSNPSASQDGSDPASAIASGRAGPSSNVNPRKRNRLESSSLSLVSEATTGSSGATITGTISTAPSSVDLVANPNTTATANSMATPGRTGAGLPPGVTKRSQLLPPTAGAARHAAHRVLTLAQESLHAVKGVTGVFKDTLDRAETWVERFRRVGYGQSHRYVEDSDASGGSPHLLRPPPKHLSQSSSPSVSSPRGLERRRLQMTPRELHLEALARSMPSVGPYGPYGTGNTPPMSPVLGPQTLTSGGGSGGGGKDRNNVFPFDNPAPGYGWVGGRRKSDSGLSAVPTLNLSETNQSGRSRAGSMSQYESSTGESLPPPSVIGSTSSVAGDDEDEDGDYERQRGQMVMGNNRMDEDDGIEYRVRKRRRKEEIA